MGWGLPPIPHLRGVLLWFTWRPEPTLGVVLRRAVPFPVAPSCASVVSPWRLGRSPVLSVPVRTCRAAVAPVPAGDSLLHPGIGPPFLSR